MLTSLQNGWIVKKHGENDVLKGELQFEHLRASEITSDVPMLGHFDGMHLVNNTT